MKRILLATLVLTTVLFKSCQTNDKKRTETVKEKKIAKLKSPKNNAVLKRGDLIDVELALKEIDNIGIDSIGVYLDDNYQGGD